MLMHGKLFLTPNGCMLDEVKSLLQKALRRKHKHFVTQSAKELLCFGKEQLQWKSIFTYLFEDHCLSDVNVLTKLYDCFAKKDKLKAVELLFNCYTCRVACCLPVVALDDTYLPIFWDSNIECIDQESGLVTKKSGCLNFDLLLAHLKNAWEKQDVDCLITCFKLCSIVHDVEKRSLTQKGEAYIKTLGQPKKVNIGHLFFAFLYNNTNDPYLKKYTRACFKLLDIPDACVRLAMFAVAANLKCIDHVKPIEFDENNKIVWNDVERLTKIPAWAVDKHTFRGKLGKGTKHLLRKTHPTMTSDDIEEFHGERPKSGIKEFFEQGCLCEKRSLEENPFWEMTINKYYSLEPKLQKTVRMTEVYYKYLKTNHAMLFRKIGSTSEVSETAKDTEIATCAKRKHDDSEHRVKCKKQKMLVEKNQPSMKNWLRKKSNGKDVDSDYDDIFKPSTSKDVSKTKEKRAANWIDLVGYDKQIKGPLLQLPTGSAKVYTSVVSEQGEVWKGPYPVKRLNLALFYHKVMHDIFKDSHTLNIQDKNPYLLFPLVKSEKNEIQITTKDFYDCISRQDIKGGAFVERESMGIVQLHRFESTQ